MILQVGDKQYTQSSAIESLRTFSKEPEETLLLTFVVSEDIPMDELHATFTNDEITSNITIWDNDYTKVIMQHTKFTKLQAIDKVVIANDMVKIDVHLTKPRQE